MGVYIKGMEMPTRCFNCPFCDVENNEVCCAISYGSHIEYKDVDEQIAIQGRPSDCPLIEVPPHGDLIDRSKLAWTPIDITDLPFGECLPVYLKEDVDSAPIVVESEE